MDISNWRDVPAPDPVQGEPNMDATDWRTQLQPDSRQRIVNKIMETLKRHLPISGPEGLNELKKIAVRFEEKIYTAATSQSDYLRKISLKMLTLETVSQNTRAAYSLPSSSAASNQNTPDPASQSMQSQVGNQGQPLLIPLPNQSQEQQQLLSQKIQNTIASGGVKSSACLSSALPYVASLNQTTMQDAVRQSSNLQNMSGTSQNSIGNTVGQGVRSNIFSNLQRQMQGRQHLQQVPQQPQQPQQQSQNPRQNMYQQQQQQLQQLFLKQLQGNILPPLIQSQIRQKQQNLLQPTQLQSSQQSLMQMSSGLQSSQTTLQQTQPSVMESAPQSMHMLQHQQLLGTQPAVSNMQPNQQSMHTLQHQKAKVAVQQQQTQQTSSTLLPTQGQQLQSQPPQQQLMSQLQSQLAQWQQQQNLLQEDIQQRLQTSGTLLQPPNVIEQKQPFQSQRVLPEASSTSIVSTAQMGHENAVDWQEEVYQKIKSMKETYLPDLNEMYQTIAVKCQQHESLPQPQQQQQSQSQISQLQQNDNQTNPQLQLMNLQNSATSMQPTFVTSMHHVSIPPLSTHLGVPAAQQNMMNSGAANTISLQLSAYMLQQQHLKQQQEQQLIQTELLKQQLQQCRMHQQLIQPQKQQILWQQQQYPQLQQQQSQLQARQMPQLHQMNRDLKVRQGLGVGMFQLHHSGGQQSAYLHQQPKSGDLERQTSGVSSLSIAENIGQPQTAAALAQVPLLGIDTPEDQFADQWAEPGGVLQNCLNKFLVSCCISKGGEGL